EVGQLHLARPDVVEDLAKREVWALERLRDRHTPPSFSGSWQGRPALARRGSTGKELVPVVVGTGHVEVGLLGAEKRLTQVAHLGRIILADAHEREDEVLRLVERGEDLALRDRELLRARDPPLDLDEEEGAAVAVGAREDVVARIGAGHLDGMAAEPSLGREHGL